MNFRLRGASLKDGQLQQLHCSTAYSVCETESPELKLKVRFHSLPISVNFGTEMIRLTQTLLILVHFMLFLSKCIMLNTIIYHKNITVSWYRGSNKQIWILLGPQCVTDTHFFLF